MYDLLIKNAAILDGTATPHYISDVAVKDGKIALIAKNIIASAKITVNADGLFLSPGFIDAHSHFDCFMTMDPSGWNNLTQGITTVVAGQCGQSPFPSGRGFEQDLVRVMDTVGGKDFDPSVDARGTFEAFLRTSDVPLGHHAAYNVGHGALRAAVMGYSSQKPTEEQMAELRALDDSKCQLVISLDVEDYAKMTNPNYYPQNNKSTMVFRFYRYSEGRSYMTINGEGEFFVDSSFVEKLLADTQRLEEGLLIDSTAKN